MRLSFRPLMLLLPLAALLTGIYALTSIINSNARATAPAELALLDKKTGPAPTCSPNDRIFAVGLVEPAGGLTRVGTPLAGIVSEVLVRSGETVAKGQALFQLDNRAAKAELALRGSELKAARARLAAREAERANLRDEAGVLHTTLRTAQAERKHTQRLLDMAERLTASSYISRREHLERSFANERAGTLIAKAKAKLRQIETRLAALDPAQAGHTIAVDQAEIANAQANYDIARTSLETLTIRAPRSGRILHLDLRAGEVVNPAIPVELLIWPQGDLHVRIEVDELDLPRFQPELAVTAKVRALTAIEHQLDFVRIVPHVIPKATMESRLGGRVDSRVVHVLYKVEGESLMPGQMLDVFLGAPCAKQVAANKS